MAILNNSNAISSGGYDINNSLRFRKSAAAYLSRTPASASNRKTFTWSGWVKRGEINVGTNDYPLMGVRPSVSSYTLFSIRQASATGAFGIIFEDSASTAVLATSNKFRDTAAWYHFVLAVDTTQATASNRVKLYVNNQQVTSFDTYNTYPTLNSDMFFNSTNTHNIGREPYDTACLFDGYMTDVNFIDGQQLTPSSFGETDTTTGSWKPKAYTGTYGTNGFYLKFSDIATTSGSNAGLGKDFSGNGNYWTTNNISVTAGTTYDAMIDSPTLTSATVANYPVISPLTGVTPTGGNLNLSGGDVAGLGTMAFPSTGKWYFEMVCGSGVTTTSLDSVGIGTTDINGTLPANKSVYMYRSNGNKLSLINGGSSTQVAYGATFVNGDVIGVAFDCDADTLTFYKNNTSQGTAFTSILSSTPATPFFLTVYARGSGGTSNVSLNAGQRPFAYTPPTGFVALNTYNLPDSTIKKGNTVMDATLYTGTGSALTVTNAGSFKPDFVWAKNRSAADSSGLYDSVRGVDKRLISNSTAAEDTSSGVSAFNSNGFSLGTAANYNTNGNSFVGWQWQAGQGSTSSNTSGSITSTVSVNTTAGFSVVTYTGAGTSAGTVGHGLGVAPKMIIAKTRTNATDWVVYHSVLGTNQLLILNSTGAASTISNYWGSSAPTSTVFGVYTANNIGNNNYLNIPIVAYCWAAIPGYSAFTSYTGNGSADGPFVFLGFRPKFIIIKKTSAAGDSWYMKDTSRSPYNVGLETLLADTSGAEAAGESWDALSNGIKLRTTSSGVNTSGATYIVAAWAENPFKNSLAR